MKNKKIDDLEKISKEKSPVSISPTNTDSSALPAYIPTQPKDIFTEKTVSRSYAPTGTVSSSGSFPSPQEQKSDSNSLPPAPAPKKSNTPVIIALVFLIVIPLLCCVCPFIVNVISGTSSSTSSYDITPKVTVVPVTKPTTTIPTSKDLKNPPKGFTWAYCSNIKSWILLPRGWYKDEEKYSESNKACFISKENLQNGKSIIETGFIINAIEGIPAGKTEEEYAKQFIDALRKSAQEDTITQVISASYGKFDGVSRIIESKYYKNKTYYFYTGIDSKNRIFLISFKAPIEDWDTSWNSYGKVMMENMELNIE